ncbi:DUF6607 family protein [Bernardetia sp.]|uniref:DUF6607 family protein n=1 Tax=Bernardetia sp. TaxID=1937974 RepID=UPI0025C427FB|nr:DUF6607 family protein [Bernardetia sp.]
MKKLTLSSVLSLLLIFGAAFTSPSDNDPNPKDKEAIKSMCGCYEVTFNFAETFSPDTSYKFHENYKAGALEWVQLVEETPTFVSMQHLLLANDTMIIKHWRQDWSYENTNFYMYDGDNNWKFVQQPKSEVAGQWTQKVFQVDDSPRYEGSASWVHVDGRHYWDNTTNSPLPRREFTKRNDYNVMVRGNLHEITNEGWIHEQDNDKVLRKDGKDILIATEKGMNTYKKVDDSRCLAAQTWWKNNKDFWAVARTEWNSIFARNKDLKLKKVVDKKPLFMHLFPLETSETKKIKPIISEFVEE